MANAASNHVAAVAPANQSIATSFLDSHHRDDGASRHPVPLRNSECGRLRSAGWAHRYAGAKDVDASRSPGFFLTEPIRVALCDDHGVVRSGLRRILDDEADIEVVGEAADADEAVAVAKAERPDVFVMDLGLPGTTGIDATRLVREASPHTRVLVLTVHDDVAYLRKAFDAGAQGYLVKDAADVELVLAVRHVSTGEQYVHPSLGAALLAPGTVSARVAGPGGELSDREVDVLRLVALGHTNTEIAQELYVSVRTVETHRAHLQQKLGLKARADLVRVARELGLLDGDELGP